MNSDVEWWRFWIGFCYVSVVNLLLCDNVCCVGVVVGVVDFAVLMC